MENLTHIERNEAYQILSRVAAERAEIVFKIKDMAQIYKTVIVKNGARRHFSIESKNVNLEADDEITFKILVHDKLYFLKTKVKKATQYFYFDQLDELFELIRRKKRRFVIPPQWSQSARMQPVTNSGDFKSLVTVLDVSRAGMRLSVKSDIPRYEAGQYVNLYFKIYRRSEVLVKSKVVHVKKSPQGGMTIGLEFADNSILIANKIQNVCDDLAFFYAAAVWTIKLSYSDYNHFLKKPNKIIYLEPN